MPKKIQEFALSALVQPLIVNVGRAGAANLDVIQEVEYVKQEAKMVYLLECLQKTPPPVSDVTSVSEHVLYSSSCIDRFWCLLKTSTMWMISTSIYCSRVLRLLQFMVANVSVCKVIQMIGTLANMYCIVAQEEREFAIRSFKEYKKDVLVATDVASKGLDFAEIQHVINYDMPKEIEDYGMFIMNITISRHVVNTLFSASYWSYGSKWQDGYRYNVYQSTLL